MRPAGTIHPPRHWASCAIHCGTLWGHYAKTSVNTLTGVLELEGPAGAPLNRTAQQKLQRSTMHPNYAAEPGTSWFLPGSVGNLGMAEMHTCRGLALPMAYPIPQSILTSNVNAASRDSNGGTRKTHLT